MSIAPPSDIILDVAQAADPLKLQAATTKLNTMAAASGGEQVDFASLLASSAAKPSMGKVALGSTLWQGHGPTVGQPLSPYKKFEAVLLQQMVQEMLPKDDNLFGDAASADICRSMMAEQLANQLAKSGRIGIAKMIEKAHGPQAGPTAGIVPAPVASAFGHIAADPIAAAVEPSLVPTPPIDGERG